MVGREWMQAVSPGREVDEMPNDGLRREVLPIPDIPPVGLTTYDARIRRPVTRRLPRCDLLLVRRICWW